MRDRFTLTLDNNSVLDNLDFLCNEYIASNSKEYILSNGVKVSFEIETISKNDTTIEIVKKDLSAIPSTSYRYCNRTALNTYNAQAGWTYQYKGKGKEYPLTSDIIERLEAFGVNNGRHMTMILDFTNAIRTTDIKIDDKQDNLYPYKSYQYFVGDYVTIYVLAITNNISVSGLDDCIVEPAHYQQNDFNKDKPNAGFDTYTNYKEFKFNTADFNFDFDGNDITAIPLYTDGSKPCEFNSSAPDKPYYHRYSDSRGKMTYKMPYGNVYNVEECDRYTLIKISGKLDKNKKVKISNTKELKILFDTNEAISNISTIRLSASKLSTGKVNSIFAKFNPVSNTSENLYVRAYIEQKDNSGILHRYYSDNIVSLNNEGFDSEELSMGSKESAKNGHLKYIQAPVWHFNNTYLNNSYDATFGLFYAKNYLDTNNTRILAGEFPHNKIGVYTYNKETGEISYIEESDNNKLKFNLDITEDTDKFIIYYDECDNSELHSSDVYFALVDVGEYDTIKCDLKYLDEKYNIDAILADGDGIIGDTIEKYNTKYGLLVKAREAAISSLNGMYLQLNTESIKKDHNLDTLNYDSVFINNPFIINFNSDQLLAYDIKNNAYLVKNYIGKYIDKNTGIEYAPINKIKIVDRDLCEIEDIENKIISAINVTDRLDCFIKYHIPNKTNFNENAGLENITLTEKRHNVSNYCIRSITLQTRNNHSDYLSNKKIYLGLFKTTASTFGDNFIAESSNYQTQVLGEYNTWYFDKIDSNYIDDLNDNKSLIIKPFIYDDNGEKSFKENPSDRENIKLQLRVSSPSLTDSEKDEEGIYASNTGYLPNIKIEYKLSALFKAIKDTTADERINIYRSYDAPALNTSNNGVTDTVYFLGRIKNLDASIAAALEDTTKRSQLS